MMLVGSAQPWKGLILVLGAVLLFSVPAFALEKADCFSYYRFGSVVVDVQAPNTNTSAGSEIFFSGIVRNDNPYPVVDGTVFVKVFREQEDGNAQRNGHLLVDQFVAAENVAVDAGASKGFSFGWKVPAFAAGGNYQLATFFITGKKFNLSGLSFTDDVTGATYNFKVSSGQQGIAEFEKNTVKVNGVAYNFAAYTPKVQQGAPVEIKAEISNKSGFPASVPVTWRVYAWDAQQESNLVASKTENIGLAAGETKELSYFVTDYSQPVYLVVAEADYEDAKSILGIRFTREGIDRARINFPSILKFPLEAGQKNSIFACAHGMGTADSVEGAELTLELQDESGNTIASGSYRGGITGAMMGFTQEFVPQKHYGKVTLKAELKRDGEIVDAAEITYDCESINAGYCAEKKPAAAPPAQRPQYDILMISAIVGVIVLVAGLFFIMRRRSSGRIVMLLIVASVAVLFIPQAAHALSGSWSTQVAGDLNYYENSVIGWHKGLSDVYVTINKSAKIVRADTGLEIQAGENVPVGTTINVVVSPRQSTDISWFGYGYSADSPYGRWITGAARPTENLAGNNDFYVTRISASGQTYRRDVYVALSVNPDAVTITHPTGPGSAAFNCNPSGASCTITGAGTFNTKVTFSPTYGKFYYAFLENYADSTESCGGWQPSSQSYRYIYCFAPSAGEAPRMRNADLALFDSYLDPMRKVGETTDFVLQVPERTIQHSFMVTSAAGANPSIPEIDGPSAPGVACQEYDFRFRSTDPDGDDIRYNIDWGNDGAADEAAPSLNGYAASGEWQEKIHKYLTTGVQTVKAFALDRAGKTSVNPDGSLGWGSFSFNVAAPCLTASAGGPYIRPSNTPFTLTGAASGGITPLSYSWAFTSNQGNYCSIVSGGSTLAPTVNCTAPTNAVVRLTATDSHSPNNYIATADADIRINSAPVFDDFTTCVPDNSYLLGLNQFVVDENPAGLAYQVTGNSTTRICDPPEWDPETGQWIQNCYTSTTMTCQIFGQAVRATSGTSGWCEFRVTDESGLYDTAKGNFQVGNCDPANNPLNADAGGPYSTYANTEFRLNGNVSGGFPPYNVNWSFTGEPEGSPLPAGISAGIVRDGGTLMPTAIVATDDGQPLSSTIQIRVKLEASDYNFIHSANDTGIVIVLNGTSPTCPAGEECRTACGAEEHSTANTCETSPGNAGMCCAPDIVTTQVCGNGVVEPPSETCERDSDCPAGGDYICDLATCQCLFKNNVGITLVPDKNEYVKGIDQYISLTATVTRYGGNYGGAEVAMTRTLAGKDSETLPVSPSVVTFVPGTGLDVRTAAAQADITSLQAGNYTFSAITPVQAGEAISSDNLARVSVTIREVEKTAAPELPEILAAIAAIAVIAIIVHGRKTG